MKTLFKVLALGLFLTAAGVISGSAQTEECADLAACFEKYKAAKKQTCGARTEAVRLGKLIIEKFGADELNKEVIDYIKGDVPKIEQADAKCKRDEAYNQAYKTKNWAAFFPAAKAVIDAEPDPLDLDVMLDAASVGFNLADRDKVTTYNNETLNYAKQALQKLEANQASFTKNYGVFEPFKTKESAQSWMNKIIGSLMYANEAQKKDALPYFYKATLVGADNKNDLSLYTRIASYYFDEAARLDADYRKARQANNNEENDETKQLLGLARANADRGIDALARARKIAQDAKPANAKAVEGINKTLTDLYKFRFNIAPDAKTPDLENYVSGLLSKPMPDPSTPLTPVIEEPKPTTTGTTTTNTSAPVANTATTAATTTTNRERTVTTTTTDATDTTAKTSNTTKAKTPAKKPVTKKKGTR